MGSHPLTVGRTCALGAYYVFVNLTKKEFVRTLNARGRAQFYQWERDDAALFGKAVANLMGDGVGTVGRWARDAVVLLGDNRDWTLFQRVTSGNEFKDITADVRAILAVDKVGAVTLGAKATFDPPRDS